MNDLPLRVLVCPNCGAPIQVKPGGGVTTCTYCRATSMLDARPALRGGGLAVLDPTSPAERERVERLRAAAATYDDGKSRLSINNRPKAYEDIQGMDSSRETAKRLDAAFREAIANRDEVPERTVWWLAERLSNLWAMRDDRARAGAVAQTASEVLNDGAFKQGMFLVLTAHARRAGALDEAESWLAPCDPATTHLELDTDYRNAVAHLALARRDPKLALVVLGEVPTAFPWAPAGAPMSGLLRSSAHELLGASATADEDLRAVVEDITDGMVRLNDDHDPETVVGECRWRARAWVANTVNNNTQTLAGALAVWHRLARAGELPAHDEAVATFKAEFA
jgi:hypothetical protein